MIKTCLNIGNEDISHKDVMGKFDVNFTNRHNYIQDWHWRVNLVVYDAILAGTLLPVLENYAVSISKLV